MLVPLGEKARPLEKNKASGASEGLGPLSFGATTGSTGAATCSTALQLLWALLELLEALMQLFQAPLGQFARYM